MPKCGTCGEELLIIQLDDDYEYWMCEKCIIPPDEEIFNNMEDPVSFPSEAQDPVNIDVKTTLLSVSKFIMNCINDGKISEAKILFENIIELIPPDKPIPPGRPWATKSKKIDLGMKDTAIMLLRHGLQNPVYPGITLLKYLHWALFSWLLQTEEELKINLIRNWLSLCEKYLSEISINMNAPHAAKMLDIMNIIRMALNKIDRYGSHPVMNEIKN